MKRCLYAVTLSFAAGSAFAGPTAVLSEPGSLELLGMAGVVALIVAVRRRRK